MLKKYEKAIAACSLLISLLASLATPVMAEDASNRQDLFQLWSNGSKVTAGTDAANGGIAVSITTKELEKGIYTTYVYENRLKDWSAFGEIDFSISNESETPYKFNVIVTRADGTSLTISDDKAVMIQPRGEETLTIVNPTFGTIELAEGFQGEIRVPFRSLQNKNAGEVSGSEQLLADIASWGITTYTEENVEQRYKLFDVRLISAAEAADQNEFSGMSVIGDQRMLRPKVGESVINYRLGAVLGNKAATFSLEYPVEGATMTKEGDLTLTPDVRTDKFTVLVDIDKKWRKRIDVDLFDSWTLNAKQQDGTSMAIPATTEISKVMEKSDPINRRYVLFAIRIAVPAAGVVIGLLHWSWRRKAQTADRLEAESI